MANTPLSTIRLTGWDGGLNTEADDTTIANNELSAASNVVLGLNGEISKRKGFTAYSTSNHANMGNGEFLFNFNQLGSANDWLIMVDADGDVFASTTAAFSAAAVHDFTASTGAEDHPIGFAIYDNVAYLTSRRAANAVKFDGSTWTAITDYELNGGTAEFPRASFITNKHERMFAANINNNGTLERSRIRWSNLGDPNKWTSTDWIDVDPDDGTEITGIAAFADGIVIFKETSMFFLSGVDANSFTLFPVDSTVGTQSPGTITVTESAVFFLDRKGWYRFDGAEVQRVSNKINTELLAAMSFDDRQYNTSFFYRDKVFLCIHDGTALNTTYVYDLRNESIVKWTNGFYDATNKEGIMYATGAVDSADAIEAGIVTWNDGETDGGTNYAASFRTGWIAPDEKSFVARRFRVRYVDVVVEEGAGTLTVNLYQDFNNTAISGSADLDNTGYDHVYRRVLFTPTLPSGRNNFQLECSLTSGTNTFKVPAIEIMISPRMRQRGANI